MRIQFNRKLITQTASMVAAAGAVAMFTQGCVPCDPATQVCSADPIAITVTPNGNTAATAFQGSGEVTIETPNALPSEADVYYAFGGDMPDQTCPDVYDYSAIEILDDVKFRVSAASESEALLGTGINTLNFYVDNPTYPNAALKDKWLTDELDIYEKFILCEKGIVPWDADGPDADGRCTYPDFTTVTPQAASDFIFTKQNFTASCETGGVVSFNYDVEYQLNESGLIDLSKVIATLTMNYSNCDVNGSTYDGSTVLTLTAISLFGTIDLNAASVITANGDVSGTFTEEGTRQYGYNLQENLQRRTGTYTADCSTGGCASDPVSWTAQQWDQGTFWLNDPRMVNGCPTTNVETND